MYIYVLWEVLFIDHISNGLSVADYFRSLEILDAVIGVDVFYEYIYNIVSPTVIRSLCPSH